MDKQQPCAACAESASPQSAIRNPQHWFGGAGPGLVVWPLAVENVSIWQPP